MPVIKDGSNDIGIVIKHFENFNVQFLKTNFVMIIKPDILKK
jgi:hypothetical protein